MSRVFDALRKWNDQRGTSPDLLAHDDLQPEPRTEEEEVLEEQLQLGKTPEFMAFSKPEDRLVALQNGKDLGTEKFRLLQTRLRQIGLQRPTKVVVVTSAVPTDGKSIVTTNLAIALAKHTNLKVLLIEGDLHKPTIATRLGLKESLGFSDWLNSGTERIEESLYHLKDSNLWLLPAGHIVSNPLRSLQSAKCIETLDLLRSAFDWVLIDTPPLLPLADASFWAERADGILLVVRKGNTPRKLLQRAVETIDPAKFLGVVLNDTEPTEHDYYNRYYHPHHS